MTAQPDGGTVGKALLVLDQIAEFGRPVRFSELERHVDFPKATLYRLVQTLTQQRFLNYDSDRGVYALGVRLVRLAHAAWQQSSLAPVARPFIDRLAAKVEETVHLAQLDHGMVLYVDKRTGKDAVEMFAQAGRVGPAYCTGVGKAMLAYLDPPALKSALSMQSYHRFTPTTLCTEDALVAELQTIRDRGFAFDREEHEPGIICVAVPICCANGRIEGALSVTSSTNRKSLQDLEALVPGLTSAAAGISREIVNWRFPDEARTP